HRGVRRRRSRRRQSGARRSAVAGAAVAPTALRPAVTRRNDRVGSIVAACRRDPPGARRGGREASMPVKRRSSKRRIAPEAEATAWFNYWQTGFDFFGEAAALTGLPEPVNVWPPAARPAAASAWDAASEAAWQRAGHLIEI